MTRIIPEGRGKCVDRVMPLALSREAERVAIAENPANAPDANAGRLALDLLKKWRPGRRLRIRFLDGSRDMQARVKRYAAVWTLHANLVFNFGRHEDAEIRVAFTEGFDCWSALGTDCLVERYYKRGKPTMNLGALDVGTPDDEFSRITLHEFGHAIGCIHEHQNPVGGIQWNEEAVYAAFSGPPNNWTRKQIKLNVIDRYRADVLQGTSFDRNSIMLYEFDATLVRSGASTPRNTRLSKRDISLIKKAYPRG